ATVGLSGSQTLDQIGVVRGFESHKCEVFNQYKAGLSKEESREIRRKGISADYYLASPNAIAATGELVFFSAYGNRISGVANAKNVVLVAGINKITDSFPEAVKRAREYATPLNCKRLNWDTPCFKDGICRQSQCFFPEYKRMCCQILIIEAEIIPGRINVILTGESLGY
ncbi:MAG: lactate utilization protein, partial [Candidatus Omnitrophica bacterium]|nr:lactate utilization protein [Candidatus Omnitrophota bacterium]